MVQPAAWERIQEQVLKQQPLVAWRPNQLNILRHSRPLKHPLPEPHKLRLLNLPRPLQTSFIP